MPAAPNEVPWDFSMRTFELSGLPHRIYPWSPSPGSPFLAGRLGTMLFSPFDRPGISLIPSDDSQANCPQRQAECIIDQIPSNAAYLYKAENLKDRIRSDRPDHRRMSMAPNKSVTGLRSTIETTIYPTPSIPA
jgi:hypothetical protein